MKRSKTPDADTPLTSEEFKAFPQFHGVEGLPTEMREAVLKMQSRGRPLLESPKRSVTLRLDDAVLRSFRATGKGWQTRMNAMLLRAVQEGWV